MAYISESDRTARGSSGPGPCLFCGLAGRSPSAENLVLETYGHAFLMLNAFPYTTGHAMVAMNAHQDSLLAGSAEERAEVMAALERVRRALTAEYHPEGFNVGVNLGRSAGAGVPGHLHWHLVPRWQGDTNFMPAVMDTRVIPEALSATYGRLVRALSREAAEGLEVKERGGEP